MRILKKFRTLFWVEGRFSWVFIAGIVCITIFLFLFDYYWRTHETRFSDFYKPIIDFLAGL